MQASDVRERLGSTLWLIPSLFVVVAAALGVFLANTEPSVAKSFPLIGFRGEADAARGLLSTIAGAMITFTGLVFSITILVLQLAGQQYSPRALRTFLRDRPSQIALGSFVATFTYALVVLRAVTTEHVPALAISVSVLLVLVSVGVFVAYIDHIAQSIRVSSVIERIVTETRRTIDREYPDGGTQASDADIPAIQGEVFGAPRSAILTGFNADDLIAFARERQGSIQLLASVGKYVPEGVPIVGVMSDRPITEADAVELLSAMTFGKERTVRQDITFGLRQLVDIAQRALSPGTNDPTSASQAIDRIHALLRRLADRPMPLALRDQDGVVRVVRHGPTWSGLLEIACTEIRIYAGESPPVRARLREMLEDLLTIAPPERTAAIAKELHLLDRDEEMVRSSALGRIAG